MWAKLTTIEKAAVTFGLAFVVVGAYRIAQPAEVIMVHPGPDYPSLPPNQPVHVSKSGARIYGGLAVLVGIGISWFALSHRGRK